MTGVLDGIRVLDFGRYIAGPACGMLLADMGAEVIRVEKIDGSEDRFVQPVTETGDGTNFLNLNRNKLSLTLNPTMPEGREVVRRLVATADVVVANLPPQTLVQMGLDYASLTAIKPDIILTTVSAFGHGGPYSDRVGFDGVAQAMCGNAHMGGLPGQPFKSFVPWVDFGTACLTAFGTMAALMEKGKTGRGQQVEGALLRTALAFNTALLAEQAVLGIDREPTGNRGQTAAPMDLFNTIDGAVIVQVVGGPLFRRWADLMGEPEWLEDPRFKDDIGRGDHGHLVSERMGRWCGERTTAQVIAELDAARIPCGSVYTAQQALDDPHIRQMGFLQYLDYPGAPKPVPVADVPVRLSATPGAVRHRAPMLGEHTDTILAALGYDDAARAALREKRVI